MSAHTDTYAALATRCEDAADGLAREVGHADDPARAARQRAAVAAAREFAAGLRAEGAAGPGLGSRPGPARAALAERVILAADMGGYLVDGRRLAEAATGSLFGDADRAVWRAGVDRAQRDATAMADAGLFTLVAETVNGLPQVAYWLLGAAQLDAAIAAEDTAEDDRVSPLDPDDRTTCHGCRTWATPEHLVSARHNR